MLKGAITSLLSYEIVNGFFTSCEINPQTSSSLHGSTVWPQTILPASPDSINFMQLSPLPEGATCLSPPELNTPLLPCVFIPISLWLECVYTHSCSGNKILFILQSSNSASSVETSLTHSSTLFSLIPKFSKHVSHTLDNHVTGFALLLIVYL